MFSYQLSVKFRFKHLFMIQTPRILENISTKILPGGLSRDNSPAIKTPRLIVVLKFCTNCPMSTYIQLTTHSTFSVSCLNCLWSNWQPSSWACCQCSCAAAPAWPSAHYRARRWGRFPTLFPPEACSRCCRHQGEWARSECLVPCQPGSMVSWETETVRVSNQTLPWYEHWQRAQQENQRVKPKPSRRH